MENYRLNLEKPWEEVKEMLLEINPEVTEEGLQFEPGDEEQMLRRVAVKLNKDVSSVKAWIESVSHNNGLAY